MPVRTDPPDVNLSDDQLRDAGFTNSGVPRFKETVKEYSGLLFQQAVKFGEVDRAANLPREITHEHIRASAFSIAKSFGKPAKPKWFIPVQIGEYISAAIAGVGGGHLDKPLGIAAFGLGLTAGVILVVTRLTKTKSE